MIQPVAQNAMQLTPEMSRDLALVHGGLYFIALILPLLFYGALRRCFPTQSARRHFYASIGLTWIALVSYVFWTSDFRVEAMNAVLDPDEMPRDGTAANGFIVAFGWFFPWLSLVVWFGISKLARGLGARRQRV